MNLSTIDPATLMPSAELDALIATEWMGWTVETHDGKPLHIHKTQHKGQWTWLEDWSPTTNAAHAGEARRKAKGGGVWNYATDDKARAHIYNNGVLYMQKVRYSETNGDKGAAESLATFRAIVAAMKAAEAAGGEE